MLRFLVKNSKKRLAWLLIAVTAFFLEFIALWFQYKTEMKPCILCIYERCALFGIMLAGLVGPIAPKTPLRYIAIIIWLYSAWKGVELTLKHTIMQLHPSSLKFCNFFTGFPRWFPLEKWIPKLFLASNNSYVCQWKFLTLKMPQWMLGIFFIYFIIALLVLISNLFQPKRRNLFRR